MPASPDVIERSSRLPFSATSVFALARAARRLRAARAPLGARQSGGALRWDRGRRTGRAPCRFTRRRSLGRPASRLRARAAVCGRAGPGTVRELAARPSVRARRSRGQHHDRPDRVRPAAGGRGARGEPLLIRPRLQRMLAYRHELLRRDLETHARFADAPRLRVAVSGASGLIGAGAGPVSHDRRPCGRADGAGPRRPGRGGLELRARQDRGVETGRARRRGAPGGREYRRALD